MRIPIVDENDNIIGEEERSKIHKDGLRHREIHVWLVTPKKEFIFSKRGLNQDTWPGYQDVTVGGHVDTPTETYDETAQRELLEETGVNIPLKLIMKRYSESYDHNTNNYNNAFRTTFAGIFNEPIENLRVEEGAGQGFVKYSIEDLRSLNEEQRKMIIPRFFEESYFEVYNKIIEVLFNENKS